LLSFCATSTFALFQCLRSSIKEKVKKNTSPAAGYFLAFQPAIYGSPASVERHAMVKGPTDCIEETGNGSQE
jgi:hypothetical protein